MILSKSLNGLNVSKKSLWNECNRYKDNARKSGNSSISLKQLLNEIKSLTN